MDSAFFDTTDTGGPNWVQHVSWLLGHVEVWIAGLVRIGLGVVVYVVGLSGGGAAAI